MAINTARDMVKSSLTLINVLDPGEEPTADEANDAFDILNEMLGTWNTERLTVFFIEIKTFNLVAGQQVYTIGSGGNFDTVRPDRIDHVSIVTAGSTLELAIEPRTVHQWQEVPTKQTTSTLPNQIYYEPDFPLGRIFYWPVPTEAIPTILYLWHRLTRFASLDTAISLPDGYKRAIRYNLAVELEPEYGKRENQRIHELALESKGKIKTINVIPLDADMDQALLGRGPYFDWRTGEPH